MCEIVFALTALNLYPTVKAYEISPRDAAVAGFVAYYWCIERTQGKESATQMWNNWNTMINVQKAELKKKEIEEIAKVIYAKTGLSKQSVCPNASEVSKQEKEAIENEIKKIMRKQE